MEFNCMNAIELKKFLGIFVYSRGLSCADEKHHPAFVVAQFAAPIQV